MTVRVPGQRVVISNPGSIQELARAASRLDREGQLLRYHVPIATDPHKIESLARLGPVGRGLAREGRRRLRPDRLDQSRIELHSTVSEVARVLGARAPLPAGITTRLAEAHRKRFDRATALALDGGESAVLAVQGTALATLRRARELGVPGVLLATLPHPTAVRELIEREQRDRPSEARQMPADRIPDWFERRRVEEIGEAELIITLSSFAKRTFVERGVAPDRVAVLPLGVAVEEFTPSEQPRKPGFRILFVGRISQAKGVGYLIEGFERADVPDSELALIGDLYGGRPGWLSNPRVRHLRPMPRSELVEHYRNASALVMPSVADSFGFVALEAMACGRPVVVSENSIGQDLIRGPQDGGFLVPIRDSKAIAGALRQLAADPAAAETMGKAARGRALGFSWEAFDRRLLSIFGA